jgi:hypothetical protein
MSTDQTSGRQAEQQPEPADAAGCKSEMDRSVQGTDLRSGFAELRARCKYAKISWMRRSLDPAWPGADAAFDLVLRWIDELSGCEECKPGGK